MWGAQSGSEPHQHCLYPSQFIIRVNQAQTHFLSWRKFWSVSRLSSQHLWSLSFCSVELNFRSTAAAHTMRQPSSAVLISCFPSRPDPLYPGRSTQTVLCSQMNVKSIWRAFLHWPWVLNILKVSHVWLRLFPITVNHSAACRLLCFCSFSSAENEWTQWRVVSHSRWSYVKFPHGLIPAIISWKVTTTINHLAE